MKMLLLISAVLFGSVAAHAERISLSKPGNLELRTTQAQTAIYHGRQALKLTEKPAGSGQLLAIVRNRAFHDGTIDVDVAGALSNRAMESSRGFIGIAFRMQTDESHYECIYIRPTNGRPRISSGATTPRSTSLYPTGPGTDCGKRALACMSPTPIWSKANGSTLGSWCAGRMQHFISPMQRSLAYWCTI